jgi:hypothetical protein
VVFCCECIKFSESFLGASVPNISSNDSLRSSFQGMKLIHGLSFSLSKVLTFGEHVQSERLRQLFFSNSQEDF